MPGHVNNSSNDDMQEPATCHYVLSVSIPGLCQLPSFRQKTEPISQIICKPAPAPASSASSSDANDHKQHPQEPADTVDTKLHRDSSTTEETADLDSASSSNESATE